MATNPDPNGGAFLGPYIDPARTAAPPPWGPTGTDTPTATPNEGKDIPEPVPARSGSTTLGGVTVYETVDQEGVSQVNHEPGDQGAVVPPHSPNSWPIEDDADGIPRSRDPYRNGGMIGQDFLDNQG